MSQRIVLNLLFFTTVFLMGPDGTGEVVKAQVVEKDASSDSFSLKARVAIFEDVWRTINDKFYDPTFNGVDWDAVRERYRPRVEKAKSYEEFYDLIDAMLAELRTSHTGFTRPSYPGKKSYNKDVGLSVYEVEGKIVVSQVQPE